MAENDGRLWAGGKLGLHCSDTTRRFGTHWLFQSALRKLMLIYILPLPITLACRLRLIDL
jgi:hypothetical protein